jgi:hypothetical protein
MIKIVYIFIKTSNYLFMVTSELVQEGKGSFKVICNVDFPSGFPNISKKRHMKKVTRHDALDNGDALENPSVRRWAINIISHTALLKDVLKTQAILNKGSLSEEEAKEIFQKNIKDSYWQLRSFHFAVPSFNGMSSDKDKTKKLETSFLLQMLGKLAEQKAAINIKFKLAPLISNSWSLFVQLSSGGDFRYLVPFILAYYSHFKAEQKKQRGSCAITFSNLAAWVTEDASLLRQWESFYEYHFYETSHFDMVRYIYFGHALRLLGVRQVNYCDENAYTRAKYCSYYNRQWCYQNRFKENGSIIVWYGDFNEVRKIKDYLAIGGARRKFNGAREKTFEEQNFLAENLMVYVQLALRGDFMF